MAVSIGRTPLTATFTIRLEGHGKRPMPPVVPAPPYVLYRHAAPSGPWPWMDFETPDQVGRNKMLEKCLVNKISTVYWMDVHDDGRFVCLDMGENGHTTVVGTEHKDAFWEILQRKRPGNIRVRSIFVDDLTSPRYDIEPFFFTSSINWIPSRYQEAPTHKEGDRTHHLSQSSCSPSDTHINTQAPFLMSDGDMLFIDLLAIHVVRGVETSTIISYHPESTWCRTSAKRLHFLMRLVGESVYWQKIFDKSKDPTFLFLAILWYALYAWDETFELLYKHLSELCNLSRRLNPAMESSVFSDDQRKASEKLMETESDNLLNEIDRPAKQRKMLSNQLRNVMDLAFASVNIDDSKQTRKLTEATVRDSAVMKQISYLTMVFLPTSFLASVFGMNVTDFTTGGLQTLDRYVEFTLSLTLFTVYVVVTLQTQSAFHDPDAPFL
ncbi:hypothetical protein BDR04DRAFT_1098684 [Suillus decipiens]|nr:hypothetical protein BDR04DRAFT_1098684 [Suillus decipiens]